MPVSLRLATCAFAATCASALFGQTSTASHDHTTTTATANAEKALNHADRKFVDKAAESGEEEVAISKIAVERSTNADVKKFAQMMVDDHSRANEELTSLASARGVAPKEKKHKDDKWAKKDAKDFDRDYVKKMVEDHKEAVELFTNESKNGQDAGLVDFARKTLPKLEHHLQEADALKKTLTKM